METIKKHSINRWKTTALFMLLMTFVLTGTTAKAQVIDECMLDSTSFSDGLDSLARLTANSINGNAFTPRGEMRVLIIYAGFTNDKETSSLGLVWPYDDGINPPGKSFPSNTWDLFYDDYSDFSLSNTDNSISNYYYQMSLQSGNPLKIIAGVFPERINVPGTINTQWGTYANWVYDSIQAKYPGYDFSAFDSRTNGPNYQYDNSDTINHPHDNKIDFTILIFRYSRNCTTDPAGPSTLCNTAYSGNSVAGIIPHQFTDTLGNPTYSISSINGYRTHPGFFGINKTTFLHEVAHTNYGSPHINAANNAVGSYFYNDFGWGMMKGGGPNVFDCANGWERWYNGWIELTAGSNQVNTQIDAISDLQNGGVYTLRDFITTGDVIRVKLPNVSNQYLWLENHTGKNNFDKRSGWANNGATPSLPYPPEPRGLVGYVEGVRYARTFTGGAGTGVNAIKHLNALGNFDYTNPFLNPEPTAPEMFWLITYDFTRGMANPLGAHNQLVNIRNNFSNTASTDTIDYDSYFNGGGTLNENRMFNKENGVFTYGSFGMGMSFPQGAKVDLGSNPVITNLQAYNSFSKQLSPIYLNGISFEVLSYNPDSSVTIKIRMDDYDVNNDTRYTGEIALSPNVVSSANYSLNLKAAKTLDIDKSGTPNRHTQTTNYDFINPTVFTCDSNSYFHLEQNATVNVQNGSTLKLKNGSKMELENGARLHLFAGTTLIIDDGAELNLKPGAVLEIDQNATVLYNNNQAEKGLLVGATSISGNPAKVELKGKMIFDANATWEHKRDGYYHFFGSHQLIMPSTVTMNFIGKSKTLKFIELAENTTLMLENIAATLNIGMIFYNTNSHIYIDNVALTSVATTYNPATNQNNTSIGLIIENPASIFINGCDFNQLQNGITISNGISLTPYTLQATNFNTIMGNCIELANVHALNITGGVFQLANIGVFGSADVLTITNTEIKSMNYGVHLSQTPGVYFSNAKIHLNNIGIFTNASLVFLRNGTKVYNNVGNGLELYGVYNTVTRSFNSMLTVGDLGCGSIYNNGNNGVYAKNTLLNIDAIQHSINRGDMNVIPNQFYGNTNLMFDVCYSFGARAPFQINAKGNYWGATVISPSQYSIVSGLCPGESGTLPQPISLVTTSHSTCFSATSCMNCASGGGGGSSSASTGNSTLSVTEAVVEASFIDANTEFLVADNSTTRNDFVNLSAIDIERDTLNNKWFGTSIANQVFELTNKSVHHIQVAKAIKASVTNSNARENLIVEDIFKGIKVNAKEISNKIEIFPNPVSDKLIVSIEDAKGIYTLTIYQVLGELIMEKKLTNSLTNIDVSLLENGIYFYEIISERGEKLTGKISVAR